MAKSLWKIGFRFSLFYVFLDALYKHNFSLSLSLSHCLSISLRLIGIPELNFSFFAKWMADFELLIKVLGNLLEL